ncbi:MAG: hypothetical protein LBH31_07015 [Burkholderiaceae bacterium]|jgi:hypothetical protein|nr:hypothetical protein [Burkholderiaceae bacterium]
MPTIPLYPDVPNQPGVPALPRDPALAAAGIALADESANGIDANFAQTADGADLPSDAPLEQWGIFDASGNLAIAPDTIVGTDFRAEVKVADYPIEQGAFGSYNKVQTPFDLRLTMAYSSNATGREVFINTLDTLLKSPLLYTAITPEGAWENITIEHYDYRRDARSGVQMLTVDVWAREVRLIPGTSYAQQSGLDQTQNGQTQQTLQSAGTTPLDPANTRSPDASSFKNGGRVQAAPPTPAQDAQSNFANGSPNNGLIASPVNSPASALALADMQNNPPAAMSADSQAAYQNTIGVLHGGASGSW